MNVSFENDLELTDVNREEQQQIINTWGSL